MNRKRLRELYKVELKVDPKTGKDKRVARYVGDWYAVDVAARDKVRPGLIAVALAEIALFIAAGLLGNYGANSFFVLPFYVFTMLPVFYLAMATWRVCRLKARMDEVEKAEGPQSLKNAAMGLLVLGLLWSVGDVVFLCLGMAGDRVGRELMFLACGLLCTAGGFFAGRMCDRVKWEKKTEEKQSEQTGEPELPED